MSQRPGFASSSAIAVAGNRVLELAGVSVDDLAHVDLYSCFPSAVQIAARELGLGLDRQLTVTGGMSFAGGPWNNYVMHAIATVVGDLRAQPTERGLVWANGGYVTKHSFGVYSAEPPVDGFRGDHPQDGIDSLPRRELASQFEARGPATIEAYTVMHSRDGEPEIARMMERLRANRDFVFNALSQMRGLTVPSPEGAFYLFNPGAEDSYVVASVGPSTSSGYGTIWGTSTTRRACDPRANGTPAARAARVPSSVVASTYTIGGVWVVTVRE
jgi:hypothetical protein